MAEINGVARPYAKAILDLAYNGVRREYWNLILSRLECIALDEHASCLLNNPTIEVAAKIDFIKTVIGVAKITQFAAVEATGAIVRDSAINVKVDAKAEPDMAGSVSSSRNIELDIEQIEQEELAFIKLLAESNRLMLVPAIKKLYAQFCAELEQDLMVEVFSAKALEVEEQENIKQQLASKYKKNIKLQINCAAELLGGIKFKIGDNIIDGTIQGQLLALSRNILGNNKSNVL